MTKDVWWQGDTTLAKDKELFISYIYIYTKIEGKEKRRREKQNFIT